MSTKEKDFVKSRKRNSIHDASFEPTKELNILILGETGVGKSTWINGFINYLSFDSLEDAMQRDPIYLIPTSFKIIDGQFQEMVVNMGERNDNEISLNNGQSVTQMPKSYCFTLGDTIVRLIDTPGIGDTRGKEQDKLNFEHIMSHLSDLDTLHGICILLKPNNARITDFFEFCLNELLMHLHKDACKNITFVFTYSRGTNYQSGDTVAILKKLLKRNNLVNDVLINKNTIYFMDNEAVRFLASYKTGVKYQKLELALCSKSWDKSVDETQRLMRYLSTLHPHSARNTVSLIKARHLILSLPEPLANISKNIQANIRISVEKRNEIEHLKEIGNSLKGKLTTPVIEIKTINLKHPRLVCTSDTCTEFVFVKGIKTANYIQCCHDQCYIKGPKILTSIKSLISLCNVIKNGKCAKCGCSVKFHQRLTYQTEKIVREETDKEVEKLLNEKEGNIHASELFLSNLNKRLCDLEAEQTKLIKIGVQLSLYLKQKSTLVASDFMMNYLQHDIKIQKMVVNSGGNNHLLLSLEHLKSMYEKEKEEMQYIKISLEPEDIEKMIQNLHSLPLNGKALKECMVSFQEASSRTEKHQNVTNVKVKKTLWEAWGKTKDLFSGNTDK